LQVQDSGDGLEQRVVLPGLGYEFGRAGLHARHGQRDAPPPREQNNGYLRSRCLELRQQGQAIGPSSGSRKIHVEQNELRHLLAHSR
jgi:hypothetical protein